MAFGKRIVQEIELQGQQVRQEFQSISKAGTDAFSTINKGAGESATRLGAIEAAAKRAGISVGDFQKRMADSSNTLARSAPAAKEAAAGITGFGNAAQNVERSFVGANNAGVRIGQTLRLVGRAAGVPEIGLLGRNVGILGRAFTVAAPVIFIAGLAKVAAGSAQAAEQINQLSAENKTTTKSFQELVSAEVAVGGGAEEADKSFKALSSEIHTTASNAKSNEATMSGLKGQLDQTKRSASDLAGNWHDIGQQSKHVFEMQFPQNNKVLKQLDDQREAQFQLQRNIARQIDAEDQLEQKQRQIEKAMRDARQEADNNATSLDKLGISATDGAGKIKKVPDVLKELADALKNSTDESKRTEAENALVAAGFDRKLLPSLRKGVDGYKELITEGEKIRTPFTPEQLQSADNFTSAMGKASSALGGLADSIGKAVMPAFKQVLDDITSVAGKIEDATNKIKEAGAAKDAALSAGSGGGGGGAQEQQFARGGPVWGAGSATSDSIPAWLSNGEYVHKAKAAQYYGRAVMDALNNMRIPRDFFRRFASGGAVTMAKLPSMPTLRMAKGGSVSTPVMRPLVLDLGSLGQFAGLLAPEHVASKLIQVGTTRQLASGGRKPSSYGAR
jgi:hypothetical protein